MSNSNLNLNCNSSNTGQNAPQSLKQQLNDLNRTVQVQTPPSRKRDAKRAGMESEETPLAKRQRTIYEEKDEIYEEEDEMQVDTEPQPSKKKGKQSSFSSSSSSSSSSSNGSLALFKAPKTIHVKAVNEGPIKFLMQDIWLEILKDFSIKELSAFRVISKQLLQAVDQLCTIARLKSSKEISYWSLKRSDFKANGELKIAIARADSFKIFQTEITLDFDIIDPDPDILEYGDSDADDSKSEDETHVISLMDLIVPDTNPSPATTQILNWVTNNLNCLRIIESFTINREGHEEYEDLSTEVLKHLIENGEQFKNLHTLELTLNYYHDRSILPMNADNDSDWIIDLRKLTSVKYLIIKTIKPSAYDIARYKEDINDEDVTQYILLPTSLQKLSVNYNLVNNDVIEFRMDPVEGLPNLESIESDNPIMHIARLKTDATSLFACSDEINPAEQFIPKLKTIACSLQCKDDIEDLHKFLYHTYGEKNKLFIDIEVSPKNTQLNELNITIHDDFITKNEDESDILKKMNLLGKVLMNFKHQIQRINIILKTQRVLDTAVIWNLIQELPFEEIREYPGWKIQFDRAETWNRETYFLYLFKLSNIMSFLYALDNGLDINSPVAKKTIQDLVCSFHFTKHSQLLDIHDEYQNLSSQNQAKIKLIFSQCLKHIKEDDRFMVINTNNGSLRKYTFRQTTLNSIILLRYIFSGHTMVLDLLDSLEEQMSIMDIHDAHIKDMYAEFDNLYPYILNRETDEEIKEHAEIVYNRLQKIKREAEIFDKNYKTYFYSQSH